jgi:hypothetical protein
MKEGNLPEETDTTRIFRLSNTPGEVILFDIKSFSAQQVKKDNIWTYVSWSTSLTSKQADHTAFIVFISANCPDFIAIVPTVVLRAKRRFPIDFSGATHIGFSLGHMKTAEAVSIEVPPFLQPWEVNYSCLTEALKRIQVAQETGIYINPQTGQKLESWTPKAQSTSYLLAAPSSRGSFAAVKKIHSEIERSSSGLILEFMVRMHSRLWSQIANHRTGIPYGRRLCTAQP